MKKTITGIMTVALLVFYTGTASVATAQEEAVFTDTFFLDSCKLGPRGVNDYFIPLKPGSWAVLEGEEEDEGEVITVTLHICVLPGTRVVDGVRCAILRETEWKNDELVEISWNYFAICRQHKSIFYFGEEVDIYEDGEVVSHDGAWLAGVDGARAGLQMPGYPVIGSRYYQEIAPGVALDRAEHLDNAASVETMAGEFEDCLWTVETTPLEPGEESYKAYCRGIGLVLDNVVTLVDYGHGRRACDDDSESDDESDDDSSDERRDRRPSAKRGR